jgi:hypothetical protein
MTILEIRNNRDYLEQEEGCKMRSQNTVPENSKQFETERERERDGKDR